MRCKCPLCGWITPFTVEVRELPVHHVCEGIDRAPDMLCGEGYVIHSRGLGDTVAMITRAIGIKPCGGCKKRKTWLNKLFPYTKKRQ